MVILHPSFADKIDSDFDEIACQTRTHLGVPLDPHRVGVAFACDFAEFVASVEFFAANERPARKSVPSAELTRASPHADLAGRPSSSALAGDF